MSTAEQPTGDSSLLWLAPRSLIGPLRGTLWRALGGSNALGLGLLPYGLLSAPQSIGWMGGISTTQGDPGAACYFSTSFSLHLESDQMFLLASLDAGVWWRLSRKAAGQKPSVAGTLSSHSTFAASAPRRQVPFLSPSWIPTRSPSRSIFFKICSSLSLEFCYLPSSFCFSPKHSSHFEMLIIKLLLNSLLILRLVLTSLLPLLEGQFCEGRTLSPLPLAAPCLLARGESRGWGAEKPAQGRQ